MDLVQEVKVALSERLMVWAAAAISLAQTHKGAISMVETGPTMGEGVQLDPAAHLGLDNAAASRTAGLSALAGYGSIGAFVTRLGEHRFRSRERHRWKEGKDRLKIISKSNLRETRDEHSIPLVKR
jgi:hypothetical protein